MREALRDVEEEFVRIASCIGGLKATARGHILPRARGQSYYRRC
jgi:hypothetical protein